MRIPPRLLGRREFLRRGALAGLGVGLLPLAGARVGLAAEPPRVRRRVALRGTDLELPDIGFGSSRLRGGEDLVRYALERGVTHFDTAEGYTGGESERVLGRALRGERDRVTLTSKVKAETSASRGELMQRLEGSLRRLQTDFVDIYLNHAVNDPDRVRNPEWLEFVRLAKEQGKIRYAGLSGHGGRLVECVDAALDQGGVDVMLLAVNYGQDPSFVERFTARLDFVATQPDLPRVLARAHAEKVGVIAMKTLRGGRLNDLRPYESGDATFAQAAFRWVLSNPHVDSLVVTMKSREQIDEYLGASGWTREHPDDQALLERYERRNGASQCRYGCDACASSCPVGVPIAEVLRTRMYAEDYGDPELAREDYARLGAGASPCLSCADRTCTDACPHGIPISRLTTRTHRLLA